MSVFTSTQFSEEHLFAGDLRVAPTSDKLNKLLGAYQQLAVGLHNFTENDAPCVLVRGSNLWRVAILVVCVAKTNKQTLWPKLPTERKLLVGEVSADFCGKKGVA
jgi:hypothetical protein